MEEKCAVKKCKGTPYLTYGGKPVCIDCWAKHCDDNNRFDLHKILKIEEKIYD
jgi:hypothetical protein